jgi:large subunit ribosomal protein L7A
MSYEKVKQAKSLRIGTKQATKVVELGTAIEVVIASDADPRLTAKIAAICKKAGVEVIYVDSMKLLGKACGIEVGAAMVAIVNE